MATRRRSSAPGDSVSSIWAEYPRLVIVLTTGSQASMTAPRMRWARAADD